MGRDEAGALGLAGLFGLVGGLLGWGTFGTFPYVALGSGFGVFVAVVMVGAFAPKT